MTLMEFTEKDLKTDSLNMYRICRKRSTTERPSGEIWPKKKKKGNYNRMDLKSRRISGFEFRLMDIIQKDPYR